MTEKEKAINIIKNIIDYNSVQSWGKALRYAVKELEEKLTSDNSDYAKCPQCGSKGTFLYRTCGACDWNDDVREYVKDSIKTLRSYLIEEAQRFDTELDNVIGSSREDLPKHVNVESDAAQEMLKSLLEGKDEPDNMEPFLQVLYNSEFSFDDYKDLGINDGQLLEMGDMASKLGMEEESKRAYEARYFE